VLSACQRLHPSASPLSEVLGCVTSIALTADEAVPPFANTAMDGYAVRAADSPGELQVVATLPAGADPAGVHVGPGEAARIMTGAAVPDGADAIVMVERTESLDDGARVRIEVAASPGDFVRTVGSDLATGAEVFPAFTPLTPAHLGVLASLGMRRVPVFPRPRVGVLSTGDELVELAPPGSLRAGQIRDANRYSLLAMVAEADCTPVDLGIVGDSEDAIKAAVTEGLSRCDVLVTSGGVSVGDFDYVKRMLESMQVAIKPAKPLAFGLIDGKPVFGLPGNTVSSMVSFELFCRPALRQMLGYAPNALDRPRVSAVADEAFSRTPDGKTHFVRVMCTYDPSDARFHVRSAGAQGSHVLSAMAAANALAVLPDGDGAAPGEAVSVLILR
jgi:molybdopterin molybdotransferase